MSSVVRYSGHYNLILRTIQYYIPKLLYSIGIQQYFIVFFRILAKYVYCVLKMFIRNVFFCFIAK